VKEKYFKDETASSDIKLEVSISEKKRTGHNVIGYINNGAATTVIFGAHYDHLGYGEDHNSLYTGSTPMIHNGADDNASGTAALIELGKQMKKAKLKNNNYLFIAFSGEELGLYGSKYFTEHPTIDLSKVNYMINMDMVGRLNDSTHGVTIGGYGTSPAWGQQISSSDRYFKINFDSSGVGPSDHTSFYRKDIPVLFFFTGAHSDYHKPSDDADKINYTGELMLIKYIYNLVDDMNDKGKLAFTKTREAAAAGRRSFSVSLGIMPDYTYSGAGVRADGVSEGKLAQKVGIKAGDVITQIGDHKVTDVQGYMQVLSKFNKGDATKVKVTRGKEELVFDVVF
ncbi:MAG TPA: M20/M25/M40 family metallo-hydrolase, partial [Ferruginibacter sp.]|nr:M20/M25/M40 family metallo-hydrolase [Ferruginibacter sp.]